MGFKIDLFFARPEMLGSNQHSKACAGLLKYQSIAIDKILPSGYIYLINSIIQNAKAMMERVGFS